jgi:hypothetical protein
VTLTTLRWSIFLADVGTLAALLVCAWGAQEWQAVAFGVLAGVRGILVAVQMTRWWIDR